MLVGNKKELRSDQRVVDTLAKINKVPLKTEDGLVMAGNINAYTYLECSAKQNEGIDEVFVALIRASLKSKIEDQSCRCIVL